MAKKKSVYTKRTRNGSIRPVRISKEMLLLINFIKAQYLLKGKPCPSTPLITKRIAEKIKKEDMIKEDFIRF